MTLPRDARYERLRVRAFGVTWLVYASYYLTRQSFSVAKKSLEHGPIGLSRQDLGLVDSAYQITYSLGQFVFGPLVDRFGPRRILLGGMAMSALAAVGSGCSSVLIAFLGFAVLQGAAQSTGWTAVSKVMSSWFSLRERGRVIGWWCTHYTAGAAIATPLAGWLVIHYGYRSPGADAVTAFWPAAFWGPAAVLSVIALVMWVLLYNRPEEAGLPPIEQYHGEPQSLLSEEESAKPLPEGSWDIIREVLTTPSVWILALAYFPVKLVRYSLYFWGPVLVNERLQTNEFTSAMTTAYLPIGGMVGVIVTGYLSDKVFHNRRAPVIILSLFATAAVVLLALVESHSVWVAGGFFFLVGLFLYGPDSMLSATAAMDFGTKRGAGTATGLINGVGSLGGVMGGYLPSIMTSETDSSMLIWVSVGGLLLAALALTPLWNLVPPTRESA
jgi:OPA family sugar phosphate sensor protein UhpC-like MFS transporter